MQTKTKIGLGVTAVVVIAVVALSSNTKLFRGALVPGVPRDDLPGACILTSVYPAPSISDPDVGTGYARLLKSGVNTIEGLRAACSREDYNRLRSSMCKRNRLPQFTPYVVIHDASGRGTLWFGSSFTASDFWPCPPVEGGLPDLEAPSSISTGPARDWTRPSAPLIPGAIEIYTGGSRNIGNVPAGASTARLCVDPPSGTVGCRTSGEGQVGELINISPLNEGQYFSPGTTTFSGVPGTHKAYFCLNSPPSITESNTDNNCVTRTFTISE